MLDIESNLQNHKWDLDSVNYFRVCSNKGMFRFTVQVAI